MAKQKQYKDILEYLLNKYMEANPDLDDHDKDIINMFVGASRDELIGNQATQVEQLTAGLALRLQDSSVVPIVPLNSQQTMDGVGGFQSINEGAPGKGIDPTRSWNITE
jgi:hypothetical protein